MLDEAADPPLHRWRSFARLLMCLHPRVGAELYAVALGGSVYREGWNVIHPSAGAGHGVRYMRIAGGSGLHTYDKPDLPDDQMNHVHEDRTPQLRQTRAWSQMTELGELLVAKDRLPATTVQSTHSNIEASSLRPLRNDREKLEAAAIESVKHFRTVLGRSGISNADLYAPAIRQVTAYMDFACDGTHSANALSWILTELSAKFSTPVTRSSDFDRVLAGADHLRGLTFDLLQARGDRSLASFCEMTYLALLYGNTSILLYDRLIADSEPEHRETFQWRRFAVDEKLAHEAAPSLTNAMWYCPVGLAESMTAFPAGDRSALYPGAHDPWKRREIDPAQRWQAVVDFSARAKSIDLAEIVKGSHCPVSPVLRRHLLEFLLFADSSRRA